jgi:hypothetical protein
MGVQTAFAALPIIVMNASGIARGRVIDDHSADSSMGMACCALHVGAADQVRFASGEQERQRQRDRQRMGMNDIRDWRPPLARKRGAASINETISMWHVRSPK